MNIRTLLLGKTDFKDQYEINPDVEWNYEAKLDPDDKEYDVVLIERMISDEEADILQKITRAYCLFFIEGTLMTTKMRFLNESRCGRELKLDELKDFLSKGIRNYFGRPYGEKFDQHRLIISPNFKGSVKINGYTEVSLNGFFGDDMRQVAFYNGNIPIEAGQAIDLWPEFEKDPGVGIELKLTQFGAGRISEVEKEWIFSEEDMKNVLTIENPDKGGPVFASFNACGEGNLKIISLHDRYSRRGRGYFLPGGKRKVSSEREELFTYFDPGDMKPPLCVYFSGYKTLEGFEGYFMMRHMGHPFLLISEARLEGGDFYLGSKEYEEMVISSIRSCMDKLGFNNNDLILSGLSMGTFGAMYYASFLKPGNIIIGKPLLSLGNVAKNERIERPGGFPTSLDVLFKEYGSLNDDAVLEMNNRFWDRFDSADWSGVTFYISYMIEDDYDKDAYERLLLHMKAGSRIIGSGLHGRHNDDTRGIVNWFVKQYRKISDRIRTENEQR